MSKRKLRHIAVIVIVTTHSHQRKKQRSLLLLMSKNQRIKELKSFQGTLLQTYPSMINLSRRSKSTVLLS